MIETKRSSKIREKRKFIISRLTELNHLPRTGELSEEQQTIMFQLNEFDFSYWEKVKEENGWGVKLKKSPEDYKLGSLRHKNRERLRNIGFLPPYGDPLNDEQQKISDQIDQNDFSYWEKVKEENGWGNLRKLNKPLIEKTPSQRGYTSTSEIKATLFRLRLTQILPPVGELLNDEQQSVIDDVKENWFGKQKNYFIAKYLHMSTPEGRLYYRLYRSHRESGYRFNITIDDIKIPEYCPILNIKLSTNPEDKDSPNYYTGDRIDSSKGLVKGNIQIMSLRANKMKNNATQLDLLTFATNGLKLLKDVK